MLDSYNREITYLRISVTDRCNLRCRYCMPEEGVALRDHADFLSFEQIRDIVKAGAELGIRKIRLTGGEPLVKKGIADLVKLIREVPGIEHLGMTTNGILLPRYIDALKAAGLSSVNISLDTLDPERYTEITRGGILRDVVAGVDAALTGRLPVKINMVVLEGTTPEEIDRMKSFCLDREIKLQFIGQYSLFEEKRDAHTFDRPPDCRKCNRIRLLADGKLKPCLHSNTEIPVDFSDIGDSIRKTILSKPDRGCSCTNRNMVEIGG